jgi:hypothetical protein
MNDKAQKTLNILIATVWIVNGLFCKILNLVPRHQLIVARILGDTYAIVLTKAIGLSELLMAVWILSNIKPRWCTLTQMFIVGLMNVIEFVLAPDLLLFGRINMLVAVCFIAFLYWDEFLTTTP